jgi:hypothetical protein
LAVQQAFGEPVGLGGEDRAQIGGTLFDGLLPAGLVHPGSGLVQGLGTEVAGFVEDGITLLPLPQAVAGEVFEVQIPSAIPGGNRMSKSGTSSFPEISRGSRRSRVRVGY